MLLSQWKICVGKQHTQISGYACIKLPWNINKASYAYEFQPTMCQFYTSNVGSISGKGSLMMGTFK